MTYTLALWDVGRDVSEDIRASAIGAIGNWIRLMPSMFLVDNYLKYLAWALSDKARGFRCCAAAFVTTQERFTILDRVVRLAQMLIMSNRHVAGLIFA